MKQCRNKKGWFARKYSSVQLLTCNKSGYRIVAEYEGDTGLDFDEWAFEQKHDAVEKLMEIV